VAKSGIKTLFPEFFAWWKSATWGTRLSIWRSAQQVGVDEFGNTYFWDRKNDRRYVIYEGDADPSKIPSGWYGWIHHRLHELPTEQNYTPREWEKPHLRNMTGTAQAYRPEGSLLKSGQRPRVTGDYDAWSPD